MKLSRKLTILFWLIVLATVLAEETFQFEWTRSDECYFVSVIVFALTIFGWFLADSKERDFSASMPLKIAVAAFGILALPYYKFRYFGARSGFRFLANVAMAFLAVVIVGIVIDMLAAGGGAA